MVRHTLIHITIEQKESFPKDVKYGNYPHINLDAIVSTDRILYNKFLLTISKEKALEWNFLEPNILNNLEHLNIYSDFDPLSSPTL